jgi:hypothetical protein
MFEINLLSVPDPGLFFSALVPGFTSPRSVDLHTSGGDAVELELVPDTHADAVALVDEANRSAVWHGELRLDIYAPTEAPPIRVAYCHSTGGDADSHIIDVVDKHFSLRPGFQEMSITIADCTPIRGTLTRDGVTSIRIGGAGQTKRSSLFISAHLVGSDGNVTPLRLTATGATVESCPVCEAPN